MPPLVLGAIGAISLSLLLFGWALLSRPSRLSRRVTANLQRGLQRDRANKGNDDDTSSEQLAVVARRLTPRGFVRRLDRLLVKAGRPAGWSLGRLLVAKLVLGLSFALLTVLYARATTGALPVVMGVAVTVVGYFLPELLLYNSGQKRSKQIGLELADTLDQMTIAVEAGLGFDSAMLRSGKNGKGPLAEELVRTLQDIQVGQSRRQAYEGLAQRTDVPDLRRFIRAVVQADVYGIAVADVLRTQANEMRLKRRQRAEEIAMQIPVKVIFPLMLCILPVLFIVLLGPAAMDIVQAFS